jgi:hypothetical protein
MRGNSDRNASLKIGNRLFERFGIFFEEKPQTLPLVGRTEQSVGVVPLQEPKSQAVGQLSQRVWHESDNGHGTAQNEKPGLAGLVHDFTNSLRTPMSRIYDPTARRSDYVGESEVAGL